MADILSRVETKIPRRDPPVFLFNANIRLPSCLYSSGGVEYSTHKLTKKLRQKKTWLSFPPSPNSIEAAPHFNQGGSFSFFGKTWGPAPPYGSGRKVFQKSLSHHSSLSLLKLMKISPPSTLVANFFFAFASHERL